MNKKRSITTLLPSLLAVTILTIIVSTTVLVISTTSSTNNNNNHHHLGVVASSSLIPSANAQTTGSNNNTTTSPVGGGNATSAAALDCSTIPPKIGAKAVSIPNPNREVCDIVILRESPQIKGHNGTILNKFLAINSLVEVTPAPPNITATIKTTPQSPSNPKVIAMGEFALLQTELKPVLKAIVRSDWNVTAVHNHPILEEPDMIFVHWDALGDLNSITNQTKGALMQTSIMAAGVAGNSSAQSTAPGQEGGEGNGDGANQTQQQQGPLEQLGEAIFGGGNEGGGGR